MSSQLNVAGAGAIQRVDLGAVALRQIGKELVEVRIGVQIHRLPSAAEVDHRRRRNRHLRRPRRDRSQEARSPLSECPARDGASPVTDRRGGAKLMSPPWRLNFVSIAPLTVTPSSPLEKIDVEERPPVLAVGDAVQADRLLPLHHVADGIDLRRSRNCCLEISPCRNRSRASEKRPGPRSRLPTWSARNGGFVLDTRVTPRECISRLLARVRPFAPRIGGDQRVRRRGIDRTGESKIPRRPRTGDGRSRCAGPFRRRKHDTARSQQQRRPGASSRDDGLSERAFRSSRATAQKPTGLLSKSSPPEAERKIAIVGHRVRRSRR